MPREIRLNAFHMNCIGHQSPGLWTHPDDLSSTFSTLAYWTRLAQTLERGKFDGLFLADVLGVYDVYGGGPGTALSQGVQFPIGDPFVLVSAMAHVTTHLGFGVTGNISNEPPYPFARRMSTLDHLTGGRIAWNVVTGYLNSAAKGMGRPKQTAHDERYEIAEEFLQLLYKLWEASWDDDALLHDRQRRILVDPAKVRAVHHDGTYFKLDAIHLMAPSPQRTPLLYQAGASPRGRAFAARHAECVFIAGPSIEVVAPWVADIRRRAAGYGRDPRDIRVFTEITAIVAETEAAARAKHRTCLEHVSHDGALALVGGWTGVDFARYAPDDEVRYIENDALRSHLSAITDADPGRRWTVREIAEYAGIGGIGPVVVGTPVQVADSLEHWMEAADIDGFNVAYAVNPGDFVDFVDLVVPELQRRGAFKRDYAPGTLREKLYGPGNARLPATHPGHEHRAALARELLDH